MTDLLFEDESEEIVSTVLEELRGRRGIGHALRHIDEDVYHELVETLIGQVNAVLVKRYDAMMGKDPCDDAGV